MTRDEAPLRIGMLGAADIGRLALVQPAAANGDVRLAAVAARDLARAQAYAAQHGFTRAFGDYQALLDDPGVDAVYNALPPSLHARWTIAALAAGKPVLCEKPFALSAGEARAMVAAAEAAGLVLMEAFHYRYHPMFERVLDIVRSGELGPLQRIDAACEVPTPDRPGEIRHDPALGGGALMDLGSYCLHLCRTLAGGEPTVVSAERRMGQSGVDVGASAELAFPSGAAAGIVCGFEEGPRAVLTVEGEAGRLVALNVLLPQYGNRLTVEAGGAERTERFTREPTYAFQLAAFVAAVRGGPAPPTSGEDCVAQMAALDAVRAAAAAHGSSSPTSSPSQ